MSEALVGLSGVVIGGILTSSKDFVVHYFKRRSNGRYVAVRIITILGDYVQQCVAVVCDDGTSQGQPAGRTTQGEEYCDPQIKQPKPPIFDDDLDWRSINFRLMYRILSLPNSARETDQYIIGASEHSFPPGYEELFESRQEGYALLGLEAIDLILKLRKEFKLPEATAKPWKGDYDSKKIFQEKLDEIQKRRECNAIENSELFTALTSVEGK